MSSDLRNLTEDKINQTREEYLMRHTEHAQRLDDLAGELQTLDLSEISHKVGEFKGLIDDATVPLLQTHTASFCLVPTGLRQSGIGSGLVLVLSLWRSGLRGLRGPAQVWR